MCVRSTSNDAQRVAALAFAGRNVRTIDEPLLAARRERGTRPDFAWRCADALRAVYAPDTLRHS